MNHDENNSEMKKQISPEMEARMIAWVAGGASEQESEELARMTMADPELAALKRRIEDAQKVVAEAVAPDREVMRLSEARRAALLEALGSPQKEQRATAVFPTLEETRRKQGNERRWVLAAAACLVGGLFVSLVVRSTIENREESRANSSAQATFGKAKKAEAIQGFTLGKEMHEDKVVVALPALPDSEEPAADAPATSLAAPQPLAGSAAPLAQMDFKTAPDNDASKAISVATAQFLQDTGAGTQNDLLTYTPKEKNEAKDRAVLNNARQLPPAGTEYYPVGGGLAAAEGGKQTASEKTPSADIDTGTVTTTTTSTAAPTARDEEPMVLSPFVVSDAEEKGSYRANSTLAGTRVRTDLADVSSALTAVSRDQQEAESSGFEETSAAKDPVSTFSLHVSDASFRVAQAELARGERPDPASIRPEEFYNAFSYGDPSPEMSEKVSCRTEQSSDPMAQQRNFVRIAMTVPSTGRGEGQPLRLTVLLDTSGSMERKDRAAAVHKAMEVLVSLLGTRDRLTVVGFARQPHLLADMVPGDKAAKVLTTIFHTPAEGGTNMEEGIKLAGELALRHFAPGAQNRIVLLTDGAANLGDADPSHIAAQVDTLRQEGLTFDACGVGAGGIDDSMLESLSRKGSGRYYVLNSPEAADAGFARQLAGGFRPAAENVKVQVRFNPARVGSYRLIGFEHHRLNQEDFKDDKVAAAALTAGESAVALYEVEALPQGEGALGEVHVRFRDTAANAMVERSWALAYDSRAPSFDRASPTMQLAGTAALLAEKLRGGARGAAIKLDQLAPVVNALRGRFSHDARVQELVVMFEQVRRMSGE